MARTIIGLTFLLALAPLRTAAPQFQLPLPPHASPDLAFQIHSPVCDSVRADTAGTGIRAELKTNPRHTIRVPGASDTLPVSVESCALWTSPGGSHVFGSEQAIHRIFGGNGVNLLSDAASTFKSDQIFVQTSIVAGGIGPVYFKASYGQLFSSEDSDDPDVTREELQDRASNVLRLIQNGGSAAARAIMPILWGGGSASQQAVGAYVNAGVVGPMGETDSLRATVGLTAEGQISFAVRNLASYEVDADLYFGVRPGIQYVIGPDGIIPESGTRALPYAQFAGGLRVGNEPLIGIFLTLVPKDFRPYVPDLQFTLQLPKL
jgi:hypothetical protein